MTENSYNILGFFLSKLIVLSKFELILAKLDRLPLSNNIPRCRNFNDNTAKGLAKGLGTLQNLRSLQFYLEEY